MTNYNYRTLRDAFREMPQWKRVAVSAATTDKVRPYFSVLALPETKKGFEDGMEVCWHYVATGSTNDYRCADVMDRLQNAPERGIEFPDTLPSALGHPLDLVEFALTELTRGDQATDYDGGFSHMLDLVDQLGIDLAIEKQSQIEILDVMCRADAPSAELVTNVRRRAELVRFHIAERIPEYLLNFAKALLEHS